MINNLKSNIQEAKASGVILDLKATIQWQGEEDATNLSAANSYYANIKQWYYDFHEDIYDIRDMYGYPSEFNDTSNYPEFIMTINDNEIYADTVRYQINQYVLESYRRFTLDATDYPLRDVVHTSMDGLIEIAKKIFLIFKKT